MTIQMEINLYWQIEKITFPMINLPWIKMLRVLLWAMNKCSLYVGYKHVVPFPMYFKCKTKKLWLIFTSNTTMYVVCLIKMT